jgi:nitrite reductase (NADH) large subunit
MSAIASSRQHDPEKHVLDPDRGWEPVFGQDHAQKNENFMSEPLVIIGNGMATMRLVEELATRALGRYAIAVVGEEPRLAYNRVLLSSVLAQEISRSEIELKSAQWWRERGVTLLYGHTATAIDPAIRRVRLANGATLPFTKLVLATGSRPIRLNVPGMDLPGVMTFRDLGDVAAIEAAAGKRTKAVVIGGGLLGLEAAYGLAKAGSQVAVVHLMDRLMERQLDPCASSMLKRAVEARGITVHLNSETAGIRGSHRAEAVVLKGGQSIEADLVVVAAGIRPNVDLARTADLIIDRGIVVADHLQTSKAGIYAIGECAEHRGICYGLVEPAYEQARALAAHLAGEDASYSGSVLATNLKVSGVNVFSAGDFLGAPGTEQIVLSDPGLGSYKKLVIAGGRLIGAVLFGDTADGLWYLELIRSGASIESIRDDLMFGRALAERQAA